MHQFSTTLNVVYLYAKFLRISVSAPDELKVTVSEQMSSFWSVGNTQKGNSLKKNPYFERLSTLTFSFE